MKMRKITSIFAAALVISTLSAAVSAADWAQASYADANPNTVKIISTDENGVTFTTSDADPDICKARITLDKVLRNPDDYIKIAKAEWTVTYTGVSSKYTGDALSGGTYFTNTNAVGYNIRCDEFDEDDNPVWKNDTYTITDSVELPAPAEKDGELVFMDWSRANIGGAGIHVTISDFKMYDAEGNEIEQIGYKEYGLEPVEAPAPAEEDAPEETASPVENPTEPEKSEDKTIGEEAVESEQPTETPKEDNVKTGEEAPIIALAALAASSAVIAIKTRRK